MVENFYDAFHHDFKATESVSPKLKEIIQSRLDAVQCAQPTVGQIREHLQRGVLDGFRLGIKAAFDFLLQLPPDRLEACKANGRCVDHPCSHELLQQQ